MADISLENHFLLSVVQAFTLSACSSNKVASHENYVGEAGHDTSLLYSVPDAIWGVDFQRAITGELPKDLQRALKETTDKFLEMTPAMSVAVALPGQGIWVDHRGISKANTGVPASEQSLFQVASISKAFTASIIMQRI